MNPKIAPLAVILFLHDLFLTVWMGGMIVNALSFLPSTRAALGPSPQMKQVMATFKKKQSTWVYISMVGLLITGLLLSRRAPQFTGLFTFSTAYSTALSLKHILVLIVTAVALYRSLVLKSAPTPPQNPAVPTGNKVIAPPHSGQGSGEQSSASPSGKEKLSVQLLYLNAMLAVLILLLSAFVRALASA